MSLPNLATLIPNLQSEFTHHVTLFCKIELKFYSKTHVISQTNTHFCSIAQQSFILTKSNFLLVGVRHEFSSFSFSCDRTALTIAFQAPTVVNHHRYIPSTMVPSFHVFDILVKAFTMFFTHITQVLWKIVLSVHVKSDFQTHSTSKCFKTSQCVINNGFVVRIFSIAKKF